MNSELDCYDNYGTEFDAAKSAITRAMISQFIAAGILFPDEVRHAELVLRRMNAKIHRTF